MDIPTAALCLQKEYQTMWRWIRNGMVPPPRLRIGAKGGRYHVNEVRALIENIGAHERSFRYYRADHKQVREALFGAIAKIRQQLGYE